MGALEVREQAPYPDYIYPLSRLSQVETPAAAPRLTCASAPEKAQLEHRSWLEVARKRKPAADVCQQNRFAPLQEEGLTEAVEAVPIANASQDSRVRPAAPKWLATEKSKKTISGKISHSCKDKCCDSEADYVVCGVRGAVAAPLTSLCRAKHECRRRQGNSDGEDGYRSAHSWKHSLRDELSN